MPSLKLRPDKGLLCSDFDGYKLSSGSGQVTSHAKPVPRGICKSGKNDNSSYLHTRLAALHNCLIPDLSYDSTGKDAHSYSTVYCFSTDGLLHAYDYSMERQLCSSRVVWQVALSEDDPILPCSLLLSSSQSSPQDSASDAGAMYGSLCPSLTFANSCVAVAADGRQEISIIDTGDRSPLAHHSWKTVFSARVGACKVMDARVVAGDGDGREQNDLLHVLLVSVSPPTSLPVAPPPHLVSSPSLHLITWLTLEHKPDGTYCAVRERVFVGGTTLQYCHFDNDCSGVVLLTHQYYSLLHDSSAPHNDNGSNREPAHDKPVSIFQQTDEDVTVQLSTGATCSSEAVRIVVSSSELKITLQDGDHLFTAAFLHPVDPGTATWTVEGGSISVSVCKAVGGQQWSRLWQDETLLVEEVVDPEHLQQATQRLAHLTSETWGGSNVVDEKPPYNPGQLESCDDADADLILLVLDGDTSVQDSTRAQLGNTQYIATIPWCTGSPPLFCLRHDVDGLVWRVDRSSRLTADQGFVHTATFNAFGYVRAGKTMAKFTSAPPDCSYVAVCDVRSHAYLFLQPLPLGSELKNRRTGKVTSKVARQLLLSLPSHDEVMGLVALPSVVLIATTTTIHAFALALDSL